MKTLSVTYKTNIPAWILCTLIPHDLHFKSSQRRVEHKCPGEFIYNCLQVFTAQIVTYIGRGTIRLKKVFFNQVQNLLQSTLLPMQKCT